MTTITVTTFVSGGSLFRRTKDLRPSILPLCLVTSLNGSSNDSPFSTPKLYDPLFPYIKYRQDN